MKLPVTTALTSTLKIATAGGFGYLFGLAANINPKITAIAFLTSELAVRILKAYLFDSNKSDPDRVKESVLRCFIAATPVFIFKHLFVNNPRLGYLSGISFMLFCFQPKIAKYFNWGMSFDHSTDHLSRRRITIVLYDKGFA